jgi:hypothetical protein
MVQQIPPEQSELKSPPTLEDRIAAARMDDVQYLLEQLFKREEASIKMILDCLYEVGSVNIINQKIRSRFLKYISKKAARLSKPAVKMLAIRWFHKNCPQLLTDWLHNKVIEKTKSSPKPSSTETSEVALETTPEVTPEVAIVPTSTIPADLLTNLENQALQIRSLQSQVKTLKMVLVGVTLTLGGAFAWSVLTPHLEPTHSREFSKVIITHYEE